MAFDFNTLGAKSGLRKVQLGSGRTQPAEYINMDYDGQYADVQQDLRKPLPFDDSTIHEFYSHHVLEHFSIPDLTKLLLEVKRCLVPGGRLVSRLPDFESAIKQLVKLQPGERYNQMMLCVYGGAAFGWEPDPEHRHWTGWSTRTMRDKLLEVGFAVDSIKSFDPTGHIPCIDFTARKP